MKSTIVLIMIFFALHVDYIRSLEILLCENDKDVYDKLQISKCDIFPVILITNTDDNPLDVPETRTMVTGYYDLVNVTRLLVIPADKCNATAKFLNKIVFSMDSETVGYPALFVFKNLIFVPLRYSKITKASLNDAHEKVVSWNRPSRASAEIILYLRSVITKEESSSRGEANEVTTRWNDQTHTAAEALTTANTRFTGSMLPSTATLALTLPPYQTVGQMERRQSSNQWVDPSQTMMTVRPDYRYIRQPSASQAWPPTRTVSFGQMSQLSYLPAGLSQTSASTSSAGTTNPPPETHVTKNLLQSMDQSFNLEETQYPVTPNQPSGQPQTKILHNFLDLEDIPDRKRQRTGEGSSRYRE